MISVPKSSSKNWKHSAYTFCDIDILDFGINDECLHLQDQSLLLIYYVHRKLTIVTRVSNYSTYKRVKKCLCTASHRYLETPILERILWYGNSYTSVSLVNSLFPDEKYFKSFIK